MPELDPFDSRLEAAVHAFADGAQTRVDAAATAERTIRRGRAGRLSWLGYAVPVPVSILVVLLLLVLTLAVSLGIGAAWHRQSSVVPVAIASATPAAVAPSASASPSVAPMAATDGEGDDVVAGTETLVVTVPFLETTPGDVARSRDGVITTTAAMNDPRVSGTGTWQVSADLSDGVGPAWGTYRLEGADGAWEGTCTGGLWDAADGGARTCWLVGGGDYAGYSYHLAVTWSGQGPGDVRGVIVPGLPPAP